MYEGVHCAYEDKGGPGSLCVSVISEDRDRRVVEHVKKRDLIFLVSQNHKYCVEELVPFGHPVDQHSVSQSSSATFFGTAQVPVFSERYRKGSDAIPAEYGAHDVM